MEPHYDDRKPQQNAKLTPRLMTLKDDEENHSKPMSATCLVSSANFGDGKGEGIKRSNTSIEGQFRCAVTSEKLNQLKKTVETAIREHKTFTIKGGWQTLKKSFIKRNWIEKFENTQTKKPSSANNQSAPSTDDIVGNLPVKQDWETYAAYVAKCERTIMSRLLTNHEVDFYWNMRKDQTEWHHRLTVNKIMNRFCRSLYTSKEGLALLLQQMYWHTEPGVASVNFPRCYVLGFPDHYNNFVDDFRLTACLSLLKWLVTTYQTSDENAIRSVDGKVPHTAIAFAIDRCNEYVAMRKHLDIDREFNQIWDHEWDQFLSNYYLIVHNNALFVDTKEWSTSMYHATAKSTLREIAKYWPDYNIDGVKNIWILKPGNKCRGRGIQLIKHIEDVSKIMNLKLKYVIQKYIERPLIIYKTKFDIRQWFVVTSAQPLIVWMYKENYLRFSSQIFSLENFHESLHLTNHAVQCKYTNVNQRDKALPDENMWDCHTFKAYLKQIGHMEKWNDVIFPGIREGIVAAMLASQDTMDRRPNTFELYGADFMISDDFTPWLIEINSSPDLSPSTSVTARMCPQMLEDLVKVIVDKRRDPKADTGLFEIAYKQSLPRPPAYLGMNLAVRGRRVFRNRNKSQKKDKEKENDILYKAKEIRHNNLLETATARLLPKIRCDEQYKGPVIADFIEDLHHNLYATDENGVDFVPAVSPPPLKKKHHGNNKKERVFKSCYTCKAKVNKNLSLPRRRKSNENRSFKLAETEISCNEWSTNHNQMSCVKNGVEKFEKIRNCYWERETTSILTGKTIKLGDGSKTVDFNKNSIKTTQCLSSSLGLNKDLLTVGTGYNKRALKNY